MILFASLSAFCALACIFLASLVFHKNPQNPLNRIFSVLCLSFALWSFLEFLSRQAETASRAQFWMNLSFTWPLSVSLVLHSILTYTGYGRFFQKNLLHLLMYGPAMIFMFWDASSSSATAVREYWGWTYRIPHSLWYQVSNTWAAIIGFLSLGLISMYYLKATNMNVRRQSGYIFLGLAVAVFAGTTSEWLYLLFHIRIPELTNSAFAVMAMFMAYAIWRYNLFELSPANAAEAIVETMSDALIVVNIERRIEIVNPALLQMVGYTESELLGRGFELLIGHVRKSDESVTELLKTGSVNDVETLFRQKNGSLIPVSLSWSVLRDSNRSLRGIIFIGRDITEREKNRAELQRARDELEKRVEERTSELRSTNEQLHREIAERQAIEETLASEKERLTITLRSIGDGVITTDTSGRIMLMNKAAEDLTGWTQADAHGKPLNSVYRNKDEFEESGKSEYDTVQRVINDAGTVCMRQNSIMARNGTILTVAETGAPIFDRSSKIIGIVLVFRDVTEKQQLEDELFKARKLESVSMLASGLAHDFNNMLTGIITNLFMAKMGVEPNSDPHRLITAAEKTAFKASNLSNQLMTFARDSTPQKENASIRQLIEDSVGFYLSGSKADYRLDLADDLSIVEVDRGQIDQVLNNVIINADQSMPDGGTIIVRAENVIIGQNTVLPIEPGNYVRISVTDQGCGIAPENLECIFDPYFTTRETGTGLGLTTSYAIVKRHGGIIAVNSQQGLGTTISIYLPATVADSEDVTEEEESEAMPGKGRILLMDDEEYIRKSAAGVLKHLGYDVVIARHGEEAIGLYGEAMDKCERFDAAIFDLTIAGGMGGKDAATKILELDKDAKIVVSSGYSNDPVMTDFTQYGFCAAVSKPYNVETLSTLLCSVLASMDTA